MTLCRLLPDHPACFHIGPGPLEGLRRKIFENKGGPRNFRNFNNQFRGAMSRFNKYSIVLACLSILVSAMGSNGGEEIEDLIDIFESNDKIIAIIEGKRTIATSLRQREKVLWRGAKGYLGAFLTNRRFLVISRSSGAWQEVPLRIDESEKAVASMSPYIALLVAADRAIGFDAASKRFIEARFPIHDALIKAKVEDHVAVVDNNKPRIWSGNGNFCLCANPPSSRRNCRGVKNDIEQGNNSHPESFVDI